jgi:murein DD-endopeptidase MepM/ murein hydrolase activator NlpD
MQHGPASPPVSGWGSAILSTSLQGARDRSSRTNPNEVTDIIPFDEFGSLDELNLGTDTGCEAETQLLSAPELDDPQRTDNPVVLPPAPAGGSAELAGVPARRGRHRSEPVSAVKGRVLIGAMATGAALAGGYTATHSSGTVSAQTELVAASSPLNGGEAAPASRGMQMVTVKAAANVVVHNEELAKGVAFAQERAEREARLQRPLFVQPTRGIFTSNFGYRWGVLHGGVDIANAIGTPILAASDGVVIEAGASAGYGMLVKVQHYDGTVTLYGHVNTTTVGVGERVTAGDQIATMGNRGYSTGPHLHFEVLLGGTTRVDPSAWLAQRGITLA